MPWCIMVKWAAWYPPSFKHILHVPPHCPSQTDLQSGVFSTFGTDALLCSLSRVWLFVTPWTAARQPPLSMEFSRQKYWSGLQFPIPGDLPSPEIKPVSLASPTLAGKFFAIVIPGKLSFRRDNILRNFDILNKFQELCPLPFNFSSFPNLYSSGECGKMEMPRDLELRTKFKCGFYLVSKIGQLSFLAVKWWLASLLQDFWTSSVLLYLKITPACYSVTLNIYT